MKKLLPLFIGLFMFLASFAQNHQLTVDAVNDWSGWEDGSIDTVLITVEPKGVYAEIGYYLDFSTRGTNFSTNYDSLEIHMTFDLDKDIEVTDLWLWFYDTIIVADMYDKWTATQIYEDIVDRRTDPALLQRYENNYGSENKYDYDLRIFPLLPNFPRKIKMTFQVPITNLLGSESTLKVPTDFLNLSSLPIEQVKIRWYDGLNLSNPSMSIGSFSSALDEEGNSCMELNYTQSQYPENTTISLSNSGSPTIFAGKYEPSNGDPGIFQLQVSPTDLYQLTNTRKTLFLLDFDPSNVNGLLSQEVYDELKTYMFSKFQQDDSVNIILSGYVSNELSNNWVSASQANLLSLFNSFGSSDFENYSSLETVLIDGVDFINDNGGEGEIVLISNSNSQGDLNTANGIISDVLNMIGQNDIRVHIVDLHESYSPHHWIGGQYFRANDYLNTTLSSQTSGNLVKIKDVGIGDVFYEMHNMTGDYFSDITLNASTTGGYAYSLYNLSQTDGFLSVDEPLTIVGKMTGDFPMSIDLIGELSDGTLHNSTFQVNLGDVVSLDSIAESIWVGQKINEMMSFSQTNSVVNSIIALSMDKRVLSDYTAFLALEPGEGPLEEEDDGTLIGVEEQAHDYQLKLYPNPASDQVTISLETEKIGDVEIQLIDLSGRVVKNIQYFSNGGQFSESILLDELLPGIYLCRIMIEDEHISTVRLVVN